MSALHSQEYELRTQARTAFTREFSERSLMGSTERVDDDDIVAAAAAAAGQAVAKTVTIVVAPGRCAVRGMAFTEDV